MCEPHEAWEDTVMFPAVPQHLGDTRGLLPAGYSGSDGRVKLGLSMLM
jgi:hypothetical protein